MRQTLAAAAAAFVIGGFVTGAALSYAQPAPPQAETVPPPPPGMGWRHPMMGGSFRHHGPGSGPFALVFRQQDRNLSPADVQKIAEAFLLWHGNHTWKITDVAATSDGPIGFNLSTPEGSVIGKFTMDPHTGRIRRIG